MFNDWLRSCNMLYNNDQWRLKGGVTLADTSRTSVTDSLHQTPTVGGEYNLLLNAVIRTLNVLERTSAGVFWDSRQCATTQSQLFYNNNKKLRNNFLILIGISFSWRARDHHWIVSVLARIHSYICTNIHLWTRTFDMEGWTTLPPSITINLMVVRDLKTCLMVKKDGPWLADK